MPTTRIPDIRPLLTPRQRAELDELIRRQWQDYCEIIARRRIRRNGVPLRTIAQRLGVSKTHLHQLEKIALHKLRHRHPELNPNNQPPSPSSAWESRIENSE